MVVIMVLNIHCIDSVLLVDVHISWPPGESSGVAEGGDFKPLSWILPAVFSWPLHSALPEERQHVRDLWQAPGLPDTWLHSLLERY